MAGSSCQNSLDCASGLKAPTDIMARSSAVAFRECDDTAEDPSSGTISRKCFKIEVHRHKHVEQLALFP